MRLRILDSGAEDSPPLCPAPAQAVARFKVAAGLPCPDAALAAMTAANVVFVGADLTSDTHLGADA